MVPLLSMWHPTQGATMGVHLGLPSWLVER